MNPLAEIMSALKAGFNDLTDIIGEIERRGGFQKLLREGVVLGLEGREYNDKSIAEYYANLELEYGADFDEVKKAYRRLMHKYHPDKHSDDPRREELATQICQELTIAYAKLENHLKARREPWGD